VVIRFSQADLVLFAAASHDYNPLHLSAMYARRTPFGQQVVYGILGALACLGALPARAGQRIASLSLDLDRPVFLDVDYQVVVNDATVRLMDGSIPLITAHYEFCDGSPLCPRLSKPMRQPRSEADSYDPSLLVPGFTRQGEYCSDPEAMAGLSERFNLNTGSIGTLVVEALLWSSYLVGMEVPGERALYFKLLLKFADSVPESGILHWHTMLLSKNAMNLLRSSVQLAINEAVSCEGKISVLLRPDRLTPTTDHLSRSEELAGRIALVVGASRGLGSAIVSALAMQGATVLVNYLDSDDDARALAATLAREPGRAILEKGNASDPEWCRDCRARYGKLDFLILNACPTVRPLIVEPETLPRIHSYIDQAFALISTPIAAFADQVDIWTVLISSIYVETLPRQFPHYIAVKAAGESFLRVVAQQYHKPGYLIVRPPKLRTDMTNTPFNASDGISPESIAALLVSHLRSSPRPGEVEIMRLVDPKEAQSKS
jgi:NAD(P)-dependent dehydrogenase (short-subunit alcohol dehydrogenase family)